MPTRTRSLAFGLALALTLGCQGTQLGRRGRTEVVDHRDQETTSSALTIRDGWRREEGWSISDPLDAEAGATRVSALTRLLSEEGAMPQVEARGLVAGEVVTGWIPLRSDFGEADLHVGVAEFGVVVDAAELRVPADGPESLIELRWSASDPDGFDADATEEGVSRAALRSELSGLGIVTREDWGARSTSCGPVDRVRTRISIHHTEGGSSDPARQLRGIQSYHISKGWCDIGYHFLIDASGRIYEGRRVELRGTHVGSNNTGNLGIAFIGCFDTGDCSSLTPISDAMIQSAGRLVGTLSRLYGITPSASSVLGHRDQRSTSCPGDRLYPRIRDIIAVGRTSTLEGEGPAPVEPPAAPPPAGAVCRHSFGGTYASGACSSGYQCCEGSWRTRSSGCGACTCVESTGSTGCTGGSAPPAEPPAPPEEPPPPPPPAGASCAHTFGGRYAHTACSASYQCCDGAWRERSSGCGTCVCVEASGTSGCGALAGGDPPPAGGGRLPYAGLSQSGSEIPREGLANPTLRATLGMSTEPYGSVITHEGDRYVRGRVSWFGGPRDTGVTSTETGAVTGERLRSLNDPLSPSASTLASRPQDYYFVAMRWSYSPNSTSFWRNARLVIVNPSTGAAVVVRPVDWGPNTSTRRILDLSPQSLTDLGLSTDGEALVAFAPAGTPLGPVR